MTVGIGVLAHEENNSGIKPNHIVLIADTMGSFGDTFSHPRLHKLFTYPETNLYAAAAGNIDQAAALMPMVNAFLEGVPSDARSFGDIYRCISQSLFCFRAEKFSLSVFPKYGIPPMSIAPNSVVKHTGLLEAMALLSAELQAKIQKEFEQFNIGCDLIIGAFDYTGQASLHYVYGGDIAVRGANFPGYCAIGSGAENAMFWLSYRKHILGMGLKRAAYHAFEAKLMAEGSPHVNEHLDIILATRGKHWSITTHKPNEQKDCPIRFSMLKKWQKKYGSKKTDTLGKEPQ